MANFNGLTFAGALNTAALPAGTVIAAIVDLETMTKVFNPQAEGNAVASGDAYTKWLPTLTALSAATVDDQYWSPIPGSAVPEPNTKAGQITLNLTPAPANTVESPSVMTYRVSPNALIVTCTGGTF
jgi:hypothetical protein